MRTICSILILFFSCLSFTSLSQVSIATDASILRNFNQQQKFWAFGQTVQLNFQLKGKEALYSWVTYYTTGRFKNNFIANAKEPLTNPQQLSYTAYSGLSYRQISLGWKHYFKGSFNSENIWNVYGYAGFGLLLGKVDNRFSKNIDTATYIMTSPLPGNAAFKRLTFDTGLGTEFPLGTDIYLYTELKTWIPTSHYPSPYLYNNNYHIPAVATVNMGIRILIQ